ncbi:MAG: hypothetical protein IT314_15005 [Anaerolineales bacterium]|nr:hypothetical protein [Anaerolineales bacterium]
MTIALIVGLIVLLISGVLLLAFTAWRRRMPASLRGIKAYDRLNREVGLAVENGTRLHISLGRGSLFTARGGSALAGLAMLRHISERTSVSDRPSIVTAGDASLTILSQDTAQSGYRAAGAEEIFRVTSGRLTGLSPFAYAAGTISLARDEGVSAHMIVGDLGAESALIVEAADRQNASLVAASDNLSAQSIFYAAAQDPLIGEELFAAGAYTGAGAAHEASLNVQDVLRWLVVIVILVGAALTILGFGF